MTVESPNRLSFSFPANIDSVTLVREYLSSLLIAENFSEAFAYRSELIIEELWRNAIEYGTVSANARIEVVLYFYQDRLELSVINDGGTAEGLLTLQERILAPSSGSEDTLGLSIVRVLADSIEAKQLEDGRIAVSIVRKKLV